MADNSGGGVLGNHHQLLSCIAATWPRVRRPSRYCRAVTEEDFRDLFNALRGPVFAFAVRRVGPEAANDVVSETFEVVWRKRADFPSDRTAWPPWVIGIAKNKVLQELQRRSRKHHDNRFIEDWATSHSGSTEDAARVVLDSFSAQWVYSQLTPAEQQLFDVAFLQELRPHDGAAVLGISTSAFTSRVNRLRYRLRTIEAAIEASDALDPNSSTNSGGASS